MKCTCHRRGVCFACRIIASLTTAPPLTPEGAERMTRRYILSAWERARVQYEVLADSPDEARAMYERGDVGRMLVDEHDDGEIADVKDVTGHGLHTKATA